MSGQGRGFASIASMLALPLVAMVAAGWPAFSRDVPATRLGANDAAVIAGVSRPFVLPEVKGAVENATDWYLWLTRARGVPAERVTLLRNAEVTREALLAAAANAKEQVGEGGVVWLVFIGHGAPTQDGSDGLLLGVDAQRAEASIAERGLLQRDFVRAAQGKQRTTIAVIDACFSGMATDGRTPLVAGSQATLPVRRVAPESGVLTLASSEEVAGPLPGHDRPAFSYLLLGALRGWADGDGDGKVSAGDALGYARAALTALVTDKNQIPSARGGPLDLVLHDGARERGPDLIALVANAGRPATPVVPHPAIAPAPRVSPNREMEAAFREREIRLDVDHRWVRRDFPGPLSRTDLARLGGEGAPDAKKLVEELSAREELQNNFLVSAAPPLVGMGLGTAAGLGVGTLFAGGGDPSDRPERAYLLGGFIGAFAGAAAGALFVTTPIFMYAQLDSDEKSSLARAEAQLAKASNDSERAKLGLPPR